MDKVKVGIPKALTYYYYDKFWKYFFDVLDVDIVLSTDTNIDILERGNMVSTDEMCLSLKLYLGHVDYLKDKCDYILVPRIDNYGIRDQTCTNFLGLYDLVNNLFDVNILDYNISGNEIDDLVRMCSLLNKNEKQVKYAYEVAKQRAAKEEEDEQNKQLKKLNSSNMKKVLLVSHPYNTYDNMVGKPIIDIFNKYNIEIIYSDLFNKEISNSESLSISPNLYWKYSKESIGSILLSDNVSGIVFLSSFPCGLDSLVNELAMRKVNKPYLNIVIDDLSSLTGIETRIESFADILG